METLIKCLELPLEMIYGFEDFIRGQIVEILRLANSLTTWVAIVDADDDDVEFVDEISEAMQGIDQLGRQI